MSIVVDKDLLGVWFVNVGPAPATLGDMLMSLSRKDGEMSYEAQVRLRMYDPDDPGNDAWSGKDHKTWSTLEVKSKDDHQAITGARKFIAKLAEKMSPGHTVNELMMGPGGVDEFMDKMLQCPWMHYRQVDADGNELRPN